MTDAVTADCRFLAALVIDCLAASIDPDCGMLVIDCVKLLHALSSELELLSFKLEALFLRSPHALWTADAFDCSSLAEELPIE